MSPILGGLGGGKELNTPLTVIRMPDIWNSHDGVREVYLRASKYLQDQILKLDVFINRELRHHIEAWLLASEFLGKCGVFSSQIAT